MKTRLNPSLRNYFSKHFANHVFPTLHQQVDCSKQQPLAFWQEQSVQVKMQSMCFVGPTLIDLVNRVNTKLLYSDLMNQKSSSSQREYLLLNAFELLWNLDKSSLMMGGQSGDLDCQLDSEQMNLVQVLSHSEEQPELKNALSFKHDSVQSLVTICQQIRPGFLRESPFVQKGQVFIDDEQMFIKCIDAKAITTWEQFEFVLSVIVENRILKVFVAHQCTQQTHVEEDFTEVQIKKKKKKNRKKKKALSEQATSIEDELGKVEESGLMAQQLEQLPTATIYEKFNFPLKFERDQFILDFSSGRSSSETETFKKVNSYRLDYYPIEKSK